VQVEDIIGCWATTSQGRNKMVAAASSSFCDVDAQLLFELLVYHNVHIKSFFKRTAQDSGYFIDIEKNI
jgi:hypothetical protein